MKDIPATTICPYCPKTETSEDTGLEYDVSYDYETLLDHIRKAHQSSMIDFRSTKHLIQEGIHGHPIRSRFAGLGLFIPDSAH